MSWGLGSASALTFDLLDLRMPETPNGDTATAAFPYHDDERRLVLAPGERVLREWPVRGASVSRNVERPLEVAHEWRKVDPEVLALCHRAKGTLTLTDRRTVVMFPRIKLPARSLLSPTEVLATVLMFRVEAGVLSGHVLLESLTEVACEKRLTLTIALGDRDVRAALLVSLDLPRDDAEAAYGAILSARRELWDGYALDDGQRALLDAERPGDDGGAEFAAELVRPLGSNRPRPARGHGMRADAPMSPPPQVRLGAPPAAMLEAARARTQPWDCPECGRRGNRRDSIRCIGCRREVDPRLTGAQAAGAPPAASPAYDFDWAAVAELAGPAIR
jgi:hypothetical protein